MFSREFFIQRSFEVVWAIFRVAGNSGRKAIKDGLENKAIEYLLKKDPNSLDEMEEIVRLAAQINEISKVNSGVLLREIGNLRSALFELTDSQRRFLESKGPENAPKIEESFSKPPMRISDLLSSRSHQFENQNKQQNVSGDNQDKKSDNTIQKEPSANSSLNKIREENIKIEQKESPARESGKDISNITNHETQIKNEGIKTSFEITSPARQNIREEATIQTSGKITDKRSNDGRFEAVIGFKERNEIVMNVLQRRTLCHIKDLVNALPGVSERTVRYDVQRLVDKNIIERVGTGGPNSFFRIVKNNPK